MAILKTFSEIDKKDVFHRQKPNKGILGNVIEQSLLGMEQNSLQKADLEITYNNGITHSTELKTTGVEKPKKETGEVYRAKECASLTAVSIGTIEHEEWETSHFYDKLAHLLWFFYVYERKEGQKIVPSSDYGEFKILGYTFTHLEDSPSDLKTFRSDWETTKNFLIEADKTENPEDLYPKLHESIKKDLNFIDIAPRYQKADSSNGTSAQSPRFRIKKPYVNSVFQKFWNEKYSGITNIEHLAQEYATIQDLEKDLHLLTQTYKGKTIEELTKILKIPVKNNDYLKLTKSVAEEIVVRMVGGKSKKISSIDFFNKIGLIAKTITVTKKETRTEDMKLFTMDLDEMQDKELPYEETSYYQYFNDYQLLCIMFEEPSQEAPLKDNKFLGFKRLVFSDSEIETTMKTVYDISCNLINDGTVKETYCCRKNGTKIINKNGLAKTALNFPKSKEYNIFVRGTGQDSSDKTWEFKGQSADGSNIVKAYDLQFWVKGSYITNILKKEKYI